MDINKIIATLVKEKRYDEISEALREYSEQFWENEYPQKSFDDKIKYWSGKFGRQIRFNGESGFDEYAVFSYKDYCNWKEHEPQIDDLLPKVLKVLGLNRERIFELLKPDKNNS